MFVSVDRSEARGHDDVSLAGVTVEEAAAVELPPSIAESKTEGSGGAHPYIRHRSTRNDVHLTEYFPERKSSDASSLLSPESSAAPTPVRSPHMPVPQAPKRAAPPRKRPAKSPSPAPPVLNQEIQESPLSIANKAEAPSDEKRDEAAAPEERGDRQAEVTEGQIEDVVKEVIPDVAESAKEEEIGRAHV